MVVAIGYDCGFSFAIVYFLSSLARAFFHEAAVLLNRRHALRFGRLFLYVKLLNPKDNDLRTLKEKITIDDLEKAFGWNIESISAFKDINPKEMSTAILAKILELHTKFLDVAAKREGPSRNGSGSSPSAPR